MRSPGTACLQPSLKAVGSYGLKTNSSHLELPPLTTKIEGPNDANLTLEDFADGYDSVADSSTPTQTPSTTMDMDISEVDFDREDFDQRYVRMQPMMRFAYGW